MKGIFSSFLGVMALAVAGQSAVVGAHASVPQLRLIETAPGKTAWMTDYQLAELSAHAHGAGGCAGFMDITAHPNAQHLMPLAFSSLHATMAPVLAPVVDPLLTEISPAEIEGNVASISSFPTRYYESFDSLQAISWIEAKFRDHAKYRKDVTYEFVQHSFVMPSLIVRIQGAGPLAHERVVLGAHGDSIVLDMSGIKPKVLPTATSPGADDDASGVATLLEVFRVIAKSGFKPNRTLEFMVYAGEEGGLLGSQDIAQSYRAQRRQVAAVLQLDMTLYPGTNPAITFMTDGTDASLNSFAKSLVTTYVKAPFRDSTLGLFASSDHASWTKAGYPAVFPTEAPLKSMNQAIHSPRDTIRGLDWSFGVQFAKLALAFAIEVAGKP